MKRKLLITALTFGFLFGGLSLTACGTTTGSNTDDSGQNDDNKDNDKTNYVTKIELKETSKSVGVGSTVQLEWTVTPSTAENTDVTFSSSDEKVATVNETGLVTALSKGKATITVNSADEGNASAKFELTVTDAIYATKVEFKDAIDTSEYETQPQVGYLLSSDTKTFQLEWTVVEPENYNSNEFYFYCNYGGDKISVGETTGLVTLEEGWRSCTIYMFNAEQWANKGGIMWVANNVGQVNLYSDAYNWTWQNK